jgi:glycosyltransferase involved in cell wall biosynthesis
MKQPTPKARGILVLTHKEMVFVRPDLPPFRRGLDLLRQRFVIGIHYGHPRENLTASSWADFHFAPPRTVRFTQPETVRAFPLTSNYFIPSFFRDQQLPKQWDIICVTRPIPLKGNDSLLRSLALTKRRRPQTRALIVCTGTKAGHNENTDELWTAYQRDLSYEERQDIVLLPFELGGRPFAFPRQDLAWLYNSSRVFTLFSVKEGGSKTVNEALLCGLPVVLRRDLLGGSLDFANEHNSRLFSDENEAADAFCDILDNYERFRFDPTPLAERASEVHTVSKLEALLSELYAELGEPWDGVWDSSDLSMKLPSHHPGLIPSHLAQAWTSDLLSPSALLEFFSLLLERAGGQRFELSWSERRLLRQEELKRRASREVRAITSRVKRRLRSFTKPTAA